MNVFVTGGTGLVGSRVVARLLARGDAVSVLTRDPASARAKLDAKVAIVEGDARKDGPWRDAVSRHDAVLSLLGENIFAHRWSEKVKAEILESREQGTRNVARAVARGGPKTLVSASAVGFYGPHGDEVLDETAPAGDDFLARVCVAWEKACDPAREAGARVVNARIGVVLDARGGALAQMVTPFRMFVGGPAGSGEQWVSWVESSDLASLLVFALDRGEVSGPLDACSPEPVKMRDFAKAIGRALKRPSWAPVPGFALRLVLGEVANVILTGQRVSPRKALDAGFAFRHRGIDSALAAVFGAPAAVAASSA